VEIGRLQRYAVDAVMDRPVSALFQRAAPTGRRVAVVGAGPAGLACAFGLARLGHEVALFDARAKGGGLNEYGLASYKTAGGFAQRELDWLLSIGGITLHCGWKLDSAAQLQALQREHDAVYLALGLARTDAIGIPGEDCAGVHDAVDFIATLLQAPDKSTLPIGRRVVVIGGGMTAVDAAVQSKLLGAEEVHMVYRRGPDQMGASEAEQDWAQTNGVTIHHWLAPEAILGENGVDGPSAGPPQAGPHPRGGSPGVPAGRGAWVAAVRFARQHLVNGQLVADGTHETFAADMVFRAIGQKLDTRVLEGVGLELQRGRIVADIDGRTTVPGLWAGGDCRFGGRDLTVEAVEDGKVAALSIHAALATPH
jgi:dihydropyrimidine dehydrogenase (NAD+) subunit PreT